MHRIVCGIDFGTTYTAVAWTETSNPTHIEVIQNWPTSGQLVGNQVPSEIAYKDGDTTTFSWGYDIPPTVKKVKWFKLGLETENHVLDIPNDLKSTDVVKDFLSAVYQHIMKVLHRRFERGVMQMTKIDFIITVPAMWSDAAKQKTEDAAIRAGLGNQHGLEMLSEPESAAVYTLKNMDTTHSQIQVGDRIVVCDAGGGTVDLISYEIQRTHPSLSVMECAAGTGDYCGSTFIDREFEKFLKRRMGPHYSKISVVHRQQVVKNFELTKIAFRDDPAQGRFYVNVPTVNTLPAARIDGGQLEITHEEMRSLFDPIIDQIIVLIQAQVMGASQGPQAVNSILLVGGFGNSEYLYKRVVAWASPYGIQVIQPSDASTAVVRGAVLKGLEPKAGLEKTQIIRRARRAYGVPTQQLFIDGVHSPQDMYIDSTSGQRLARDQISWFIRVNQILTDDETFKHGFMRNFRYLTPWTDSLVSSTLEVPPTRMEPSMVQRHCFITSDLTHLKKSTHFQRRWRKFRRYYTANYDLVMGVKNNNLTISLEHGGVRYGAAKVEFEC